MTTNILTGFSVQRDNTPAENVIAVGPSQLEVILRDNVFNYSIVGTDPDEIFPFIAPTNDADILRSDLNGFPLDDRFDLSLGFVTTPSGTQIVLSVFDNPANTDNLFLIGGDPVPLPSTPAEFVALESSITNFGPVTTGPFRPNVDIPATSFLNTTSTENDLLEGTNNIDLLAGGPGDDTIIGFAGNDTLLGEGDNDEITGNNGNDSILGGTGDDTLNGSQGNDTVDGGLGNDTALINANASQSDASEISGGIQIISTDGTDFFLGIENFQFNDGTFSENDLVGDPPNPGVVINGTAADETLVGGDADDTINGNDGVDVIAGGDGNDQIDGGGDGDLIAASGGNDVVDGGIGDDNIGGGLGDDTLTGGDGDDTIGAGQGDDNADGNAGNDIVNGGAGNDLLRGGAGNDTMGAGFNNDTVLGNGGDDSLGGGTGRDQVDGGLGNDEIGAGEGDDTVNGGDGNDFVAGGGRNDVVNGGAGNDRINGGDGDDTVTGGDGADVFIYNFFKNGDEDVVTDFEDGIDLFRIRIISTIDGTPNIDNGGNGIQGFVDDLNITDTAAGAQMNVDGHLILVQNVAAADLTVDDFQFI